MPLKDDWIDGEVFGASDANDVAAEINAVRTYHVDAYGADPTGSSSSDTALTAALTALGTDAGVIEFGVGTYRLNTTISLLYAGQSVKGQGQGATKIDYRGSGDCIRMWDVNADPANAISPARGGSITGLYITGENNGTANISAIHIGDRQGAQIDDVEIYAFWSSGAVGLWAQNKYTWLERSHFRVNATFCTTCILFDTDTATHSAGVSSYSYSELWLSFIAAENQKGIVVRNDALLIGVNMQVWGNCWGGVTNTGVALTVGTTGTDTSTIQGHMSFLAESQGSGVGHTDMNVGAAATIQTDGKIKFNEFGPAFQAGTLGVSWAVEVFGRVECPTLGKNILVLQSAVTGDAPKFNAGGPDTNIDIQFNPKGSGSLRQWVGSQPQAQISVNGSLTDIDYNIAPKGAGLVKAGGVPVVAPLMCRQDSAYTLTSSTAVQKLFNASTNGRVTLPVGTYRFNCMYSLSAMSATSGNSAFSLAVGSAVVGSVQMQAIGQDAASATVGALSGSTAVTAAFPASQHTAGAGTGQQSFITGTFEVTTAGTVIPSVQLVTAAAAVVAVGSFFECWQVGSTSLTTIGNWS